MAYDPQSRVGIQDPSQPAGRLGSPVGHNHLPGMLAESDPDASTVVE
jgi:hypothetical protein